MNKKAELRLSTFIFGLVVMSMLALGGVHIISDIARVNPTIIPDGRLDEFKEAFDVETELNETIDKGSGFIDSSEIEELPLIGPLASVILSTWDYFRSLISQWAFVTKLFGQDILGQFGLPIPSWVGSLLVIAITTFVIFFIFRLIFKVKV